MIAALTLAAVGTLLVLPWSRGRLRGAGWAVAGGTVAGGVALVVCPVPVVVALAGSVGAATPSWWRRRRAEQASLRTRAQWPDAIDTIRGAVRSGATIAEAVAEPAPRSRPLPVESPAPGGLVSRFADYRRRVAAGELFDTAVVALQSPGDVIAERVVAALRLANDVGSSDVGRVLASLSAFVRADLAQTREIAARQQANLTAARAAVAAPWLTVAALSVQPAAREAYTSTTGTVLLIVVAALSVAAYQIMIRTARGVGT